MKRLLLVTLLLAFFLFANEGVITPGDNLVAEGIPEIPASLAETVGRYTEFRAASFESWHPTRREMLILTRFGDTRQVHRVTFPGGARTQLTFFADPIGGASYEPEAGRFMVFRKDVGGGEFYQNYRWDFATGQHTLLTDGKSRNSGGVWSRAGDRLAYTSTRRNRRDYDIYIVRPDQPSSDRLLAQVDGAWSPLDWSPADSQIVAVEYISVNETYLWTINASTGEKKLITPKSGGDKVAYIDAEFTRDGKSIYATTDRDSEFQRLARIDLSSGQHTYLTTHIKWDVDDFDLSDDGRTVAFITNEDGIGVFRLLDTATGKEKPAPKLPVGVTTSAKFHGNGREAAVQISSARSPSDVYSVDVGGGKIDRWTYSETGGLNTENLPEPELVHWKSFDGRMISGFLYKPPSRLTGKRPVIVNIHGGPEGQSRPNFLARNNYYLNELGIAFVYPNTRGSTGYGKTFVKLDNGVRREDGFKDIEALFDWIAARPDLDAKRVMVTGGSYGGYMTLMVASLYSDRIACAVDVVGISNLATFLQNTESYRRDLRRAEYGDERDQEVRAFMERTAPLNNASKIRKPLFVVQGRNDPRVPYTEAEQIVAAVRKSGVPVWYLMAKDEGHGFAKKKNADFQFYATVMFVKEFLLK